MEKKINKVEFLGNSMGELTALVCAGYLTFEQGLKIVKKRAELMTPIFEEIQS